MFMSLVPGATFQCGRKNIFKNIFFNFFAHKKLKKPPQKVAYLWQLGVFFLCSPACPKQPRTSFPFYKFFYLTIWCIICDPCFPNGKVPKVAFFLFQFQFFSPCIVLDYWSWKRKNDTFETFPVGKQGWSIKGQMLR